MYGLNTRFTILLILALVTPCVGLGRAAAQDAPAAADALRPGAVRGRVVDQSAGSLPGVTVTAATVDGKSLGTTVTDAAGEFSFDRLPAGSVDLQFHLPGFQDATTRVTVPAGGSVPPAGQARLLQQMDLMSVTETVTVRAAPLPPPPPPRPVLAPVPDHDQASVCGPALADGPEPAVGTIRSRRDEATQRLFGAGDGLLIDGGTLTGLAPGQNLVVRRRYSTGLKAPRGLIVMGEHSSGLLQIVAAGPDWATAVVVYACDEIMRGDYLAPFEPGPIPLPEPVGSPAFDDAARILFADAGQTVGTPGRLMVIDRGTSLGIRPGQRLTLFRRTRFRNAQPTTVGSAVVVAVRANSATVRVEQATDVIQFGNAGDWAAPHQPSSRASN